MTFKRGFTVYYVRLIKIFNTRKFFILIFLSGSQKWTTHYAAYCLRDVCLKNDFWNCYSIVQINIEISLVLKVLWKNAMERGHVSWMSFGFKQVYSYASQTEIKPKMSPSYHLLLRLDSHRNRYPVFYNIYICELYQCFLLKFSKPIIAKFIREHLK